MSSSSSIRLRTACNNGVLFSSSLASPIIGEGVVGGDTKNGSSIHNNSNDCGIPFGFLWTPFYSCCSSSTTTTTTHNENGNKNIQEVEGLPPQCQKCLAYCNIYANNDDTGTDNGWICPFCQNLNHFFYPSSATTNSRGSNIHSCFHSSILEYIQPNKKNDNSTLVMSGEEEEEEENVIFVVMDGNLNLNQVEEILKQLQQQDDNTNTKWGLIIFSSTLNVYHLNSLGGTSSADVYPPSFATQSEDHVIPTLVADMYISSTSTTMKNNNHHHSMLIQSIQSHFQIDNKNNSNSNNTNTTTTSPQEATLSRKEQLRLRREARLLRQKEHQQQQQQQQSSTLDSKKNNEKKKKKTSISDRCGKRCTAEAVSLAVDILSSFINHEHQQKRILLVTNGCPNIGQGSVVDATISNNESDKLSFLDKVDANQLALAQKTYQQLGQYALEGNNIGIDVCTIGTSATLATNAYQSLVQPSGGYVWNHHMNDKNNEPTQTQTTLSWILQQTKMSHLSSCFDNNNDNNNRNGYHYPPYTTTPSSSNSNNGNINGCIVDVYMSRFLEITHFVGAATIVSPKDKIKKKKKRNGKNDPTLEKSMKEHMMAFPLSNEKQSVMNNTEKNNDGNNETNYDLDYVTRFHLKRFDPLTTLSFMVRNFHYHDDDDDDSPPQCAYFQFVARYSDVTRNNSWITRVYTHRLPMAHTMEDFFDGLDQEVITVLLGREAVQRAMIGSNAIIENVEDENSADDINQFYDNDEIVVIDHEEEEFMTEEARNDIDATVHTISRAFRAYNLKNILSKQSQIDNPIPTEASVDFAFPPELVDALHQLYHLRRGLLLGSGSHSTDDRVIHRNLFIRLPLEDALSMIAPTLWKCQLDDKNKLVLEPLPCITLALLDNYVIIADHYDSLFVWSGRGTMGTQYYDLLREKCQKYLYDLSSVSGQQHRFSPVKMYMLKEGDSMSRRLTTRLAPTHADPPEHQLTSFPELAKLTPSQIQSLQDKFRFYDAKSDASFRGWFWGVVGATSKAFKEGNLLTV